MRAAPALMIRGHGLSRLTVVARDAGLAILLAERDRWVLWAPVLIGVGVGIYFTLDQEPPVWLGPFVAVGCALAIGWVRGPSGARWSMAALAFVIAGLMALGFAAAGARTAMLATPVLARGLGPTPVEGTVESVEVFPAGTRVVLRAIRLPALDPAPPLGRVRVRLRGDQPDIVPGDRIRVPARLNPPAAPAAPGAFDFQRHAYFAGLSAVGYAIGGAKVLTVGNGPDATGFLAKVNAVRFAMNERIRAERDGAVGGVMVALITGEYSGIPEDVMNAIRVSGLAHLISISGLHIGLVAGFIFFVSRAALALVPWLALRYPIKKWAALVSLFGAGGYTLIAGAPIPCVRAFIMFAIILLAVLVDRKGVSMRLVAWAAGVILVIRPEALLGPSFQLSFAAVISLIAVYEAIADRRRAGLAAGKSRPWPLRATLYLAGIALTTVVASVATAPFLAFHFNQFNVYGLIANMGAVPITGLWIMPWAVAALVLMPFGLEALALVPMGWGVAVVVDIAETVAGWPGATALIPTMPIWAILAVTVGGLWLCLWRRPWRYIGLVGIAIGVASFAFIRTPDLLIDEQGDLMAFHVSGEGYWVSTNRRSRFVRDIWTSNAGDAGAAGTWPERGSASDGRIVCDPFGCVVREKGYIIGFTRHPAAVEDDCRTADLVIAPFAVPGWCRSAMLVIDRFDLLRGGSHAVWLTGNGVRVRSVNGVRGDRPWVVTPQGRPPESETSDGDVVAAR